MTTLNDDRLQNCWHDEKVLIDGLAVSSEELSTFLENLVNVKVGAAEPMSTADLMSVGSKMVETGNALQGLGLRRLIVATRATTEKIT